MTELDDDFEAQDELNPFEPQNNTNTNNNKPTNRHIIGPNYLDEPEEFNEDDDINPKQKPPQRIKELDDSGDELEENEKHLQQQFKQNFNNLFANTNNIDDKDCVIQEEVESQEYNREHGEQKMEPFNLRQERTEGYFDQFLNYHKTKKGVRDPFYSMLDEQKEENKKLYTKKYKLSKDIIEKHKKDYENFENNNAENDINLLNEWKSLLPLFTNNTNTITNEIQLLSKIIKQNQSVSITVKNVSKKRKLNNNKSENIYKQQKNICKKIKKKKRKRVWEIESDEENECENENDNVLNGRELQGYMRKFDIFSSKATMLFANGDHNIYEQTRDLLIERIKLVENEELFKQRQREIMERKRLHMEKVKVMKMNKLNEKQKLDEMLEDFSDDDDDD